MITLQPGFFWRGLSYPSERGVLGLQKDKLIHLISSFFRYLFEVVFTLTAICARRARLNHSHYSYF